MNIRRLIELKCDEATDEIVHTSIDELSKDKINSIIKSKLLTIIGDDVPATIAERRKAGAEVKARRKVSDESEGFTQSIYNLIQHSNGLKISEILSTLNLKKDDTNKVQYHLKKLRTENKIRMRGSRSTARYLVKK